MKNISREKIDNYCSSSGTIDLLLKNGMTIEYMISQAKHAIDNNINVEMNLDIISYLRGKKLNELLGI